jgi:type II secretory ATPase GspE/PulE/Tfp pilus assembly ATPase PilB-like protein
MILVTGPTGSGKTTTMYSMLQSVDTKAKKVITLEDPIEYDLNGITQSQVDHDVEYNFATGLRAILRQDPDIIMVDLAYQLRP